MEKSERVHKGDILSLLANGKILQIHTTKGPNTISESYEVTTFRQTNDYISSKMMARYEAGGWGKRLTCLQASSGKCKRWKYERSGN